MGGSNFCCPSFDLKQEKLKKQTVNNTDSANIIIEVCYASLFTSNDIKIFDRQKNVKRWFEFLLTNC